MYFRVYAARLVIFNDRHRPVGSHDHGTWCGIFDNDTVESVGRAMAEKLAPLLNTVSGLIVPTQPVMPDAVGIVGEQGTEAVMPRIAYMDERNLTVRQKAEAPRCFACGQIDEPSYHDDSKCPATGGKP
jgi:hypothetical protein